MRIAMVQMTSSDDVEDNLATASAMIRQAAADGAQLIATPEMTSCLVRQRDRALATARPEAEDRALRAFRALAQDCGATLVIGSMPILLPAFQPDATEGGKEDDGRRLANRCFVIGPDGGIIARYDKIHLFDVSLGAGESYRESRTYQGGAQAVLADIGPAKLGLSICYDLRFPYLYRALAQAGAEILSIPAAFTETTGRAHWHVLLRARAIETGCFVMAPAQSGHHADGRDTFGHSLLVDPWGEVLVDAGRDRGVSLFTIDLDAVAAARARIPALGHDRHLTI
ncbi:carbon-nitrogen hydrolase family protein [Iodidimonas sp. MBR-22]|uniref:carbon-nitrogen hydrolase family protein n=1 Tax=unclassified Iodidimonas TaxID=2626145 RepID=UPI0032B1CB94